MCAKQAPPGASPQSELAKKLGHEPDLDGGPDASKDAHDSPIGSIDVTSCFPMNFDSLGSDPWPWRWPWP